jgi:hypothetical protein
MYRMLVMFPTTADPGLVDDLVERTAARFRQLPGYRSITTSVDALMGPSARAGVASRIMEATFTSVDDALSALNVVDFQEVRSRIEALEPTLLLYELREL